MATNAAARKSSRARNRWVHAARSPIHGWGVYARAAIADGTPVLEYVGERISKAESQRREAERRRRQREGGDGCVYIFNLNRRHDLDGNSPENLARRINHSCAPNCRAENIRGKIWLVARRDIQAGEELSFDYGFSFTEWPQHRCHCGATRCPGFIVASGQRWRLRRIHRAERQRIAAAHSAAPH
jgi:SET domain-containing protein